MTPGPEVRDDAMDPARAVALWATLALPGEPPAADSALPPLFHHLYFWQSLAPDRLGPDGHPMRGQGLIPDMGLSRRMWAGGHVTFHAPLRTGLPARRISRLKQSERKIGRTGPLGFVSLCHEIHQAGALCLSERQDLVYRSETDPGRPRPTPPRAAEDAEAERPLSFDATALFRYSALTFNGHRIHYDADYAREVEGYGGLVVHGPLLAQVLVLEARDTLGPLADFDFRLTAPLLCGESARSCRRSNRFWVAGPNGRLCIEASATAA